uniref:Uncharacterized protein n=1 Tax=Cucumis sativus TaxID=3659 RepID=A0A0A0LV74_CUCSA
MSQFHKSDQQKVLEAPEAPEHGDRSTEEGRGEALKAAEHDDGESCRTPTSPQHRIPIAQSCPTTPRKQRVVRKRKFSDQSFFEATGRGEF